MTADRLIVALGNPGKKFAQTRHNVAWMAVDVVVKKKWLPTNGDMILASVGRALVLKPQGMMNNSGRDLLKFLNQINIGTADIGPRLWVVHDDLDFEPGQVREQFDRSAAGHNGVQSIIDALGTQAFNRIRIGVGSNRPSGQPSEDYVLQTIPASEQAAIDLGIQQAVELIQGVVKQ